MSKIPAFLVAATLMAFAAAAAAETDGCQGCDPKTQDDTHREQIKADRARYDRENEKVTARPWDALRSEPPSASPTVPGRHL